MSGKRSKRGSLLFIRGSLRKPEYQDIQKEGGAEQMIKENVVKYMQESAT